MKLITRSHHKIKECVSQQGAGWASRIIIEMASRISATLCVLLLCLFAANANATGFFAIEGSSLSLDDKENSGISPAGMRLRLGSQVNRLFDIEGHFGFSFDDKDDHDNTRSTNYYGLYVKAFLPVGHYSSVFALAGISTVNHTQDLGYTKFKDSRSGGSYGFGMETRLTEHADLTADYTSYIRDEGLFEEVSAFNFGIKLYF